ncbi:MAG: hypothetical protein NWS16_13130, partial [Akkermansiaceae bacterium]|nr:hypothetical protein [Akkermansiaceae bacterium]
CLLPPASCLLRACFLGCGEEDCGEMVERESLGKAGLSACARWFRAAEATGEFLGIRYGRMSEGSDEMEWLYVPHVECDGIGGFARLLREKGAVLPSLPVTNHPDRRVIRPLLNLFRKRRPVGKLAVRADWFQDGGSAGRVSKAVAWKVFSEEETERIRQKCRREGVTVNSFLLKGLDGAVRPDTREPGAAIPWMIPVNLRGDVTHADDTENHVSSVDVYVSPDDTVAEIQRGMRECLERGEHRANHLILCMGKHLSHRAKLWCVRKSGDEPKGNIGAFSNLGVWDAEKTMAPDTWLFCPPVCNVQLLGAGCVTFQNRLSLMIQGHVGLSERPEMVVGWMERWVESLRSSGKVC